MDDDLRESLVGPSSDRHCGVGVERRDPNDAERVRTKVGHVELAAERATRAESGRLSGRETLKRAPELFFSRGG